MPISNKDLIDHLLQTGVLRSINIINAIREVPREDFVPVQLRAQAYEDSPLPIGAGQTISQPYTVVFMLELLKVEEGNNILEIGFGSGWQTALLAYMAGETGRIRAFEIVKELCEFGKLNLQKYSNLYNRLELHCKSAQNGLAAASLFDRIICAAEVAQVPDTWREQLKIGGRMVYPKGNGIVLEEKINEKNFKSEYFPGFAFVPYIEK